MSTRDSRLAEIEEELKRIRDLTHARETFVSALGESATDIAKEASDIAAEASALAWRANTQAENLMVLARNAGELNADAVRILERVAALRKSASAWQED